MILLLPCNKTLSSPYQFSPFPPVVTPSLCPPSGGQRGGGGHVGASGTGLFLIAEIVLDCLIQRKFHKGITNVIILLLPCNKILSS